MRHISRTHRENLDLLFDRRNQDFGIRIKYVNNTMQITDIPTKGSFTRESWTQLTQLFFFLKTPCTHSCCHSLVFSSVQKDDKMSKRLPEPSTESAAAKQRPVRKLRAESHRSSSSSSCSVNPMQNLAGRDCERDANRVDSQSHVQKTKYSAKETLMLSGIERPVVLQHEESEDPTMFHRPLTK